MRRDAPPGGVVYLDNNATTMMPTKVVEAVVRWMNRGDPSAEYASAREAQNMMQKFRQLLADNGEFGLEGPRGYTIIFTSGGAEGNCHIVNATARAYASRTGKMPHIIVSAMEHGSLLTCCQDLARDRMIDMTVLPARKCSTGGDTGVVETAELERAIRPNTCLISIIAASHETGAINDLRALGAIAHGSKIPFHTDAAQLFGKSTIIPGDLEIDAFSGSFHKLHGPPGVGFLAIRNDLIEGYGLGPLVCGAQNKGLRGGIENFPGIAGAFAAYKLVATGRGDKNRDVRRLRDGLQLALSRRFPTIHVDDYCEARPRVSDGEPATPRSSRIPAAPRTKTGAALARRLDKASEADVPVIVWIGPKDRAKILPNTLLFSVLRSGQGGLCSRKTRALLEKRGFIVRGGGADTPRVLEALDAPPELWQGVIRVSLSDDSTSAEVGGFVDAFAEIALSKKALRD